MFHLARQGRIDIFVKLDTLLIVSFYNRLHLEKKKKRHVIFSLLGLGKETMTYMELTLQLPSVQIKLVQTFHYLNSQLLSLNHRI